MGLLASAMCWAAKMRPWSGSDLQALDLDIVVVEMCHPLIRDASVLGLGPDLSPSHSRMIQAGASLFLMAGPLFCLVVTALSI